mgnify:CR=1 FL=1
MAFCVMGLSKNILLLFYKAHGMIYYGSIPDSFGILKNVIKIT